jgi:hypothetical protein
MEVKAIDYSRKGKPSHTLIARTVTPLVPTCGNTSAAVE